MLLPVVVEKPLEPAISLDEAKKHLDVFGFDDDDAQVEGLVASSIDYLEKTLNIVLTKTKFRQDLPSFNALSRFSIYPFLSVVSVSSYDRNGTLTEVPATDYVVLNTSEGAKLSLLGNAPETAVRPDAVQIVYYAGYETGDVPASLKAAVLMKAAALYEYREGLVSGNAVSEEAYNALIWPFRRPKV